MTLRREFFNWQSLLIPQNCIVIFHALSLRNENCLRRRYLENLTQSLIGNSLLRAGILGNWGEKKKGSEAGKKGNKIQSGTRSTQLHQKH